MSKIFRFGKTLAGFSLAELIVVIAILAILSVIGFITLSWYREDARESAIRANIRSVYTAISAESAVAGKSPRYYVKHDPSYSITWGSSVVMFDGNPIALQWGDWNQPLTNYSAGNPDYEKLRLNKDKFKIGFLENRFGDLPFLSAYASTNPDYLLVGSLNTAGSGTIRTRSYMQVAAVLPDGKAAVIGNYPVISSVSLVPGLVKDVTNASSTGVLVDGAAVGGAPPCAAVGMLGYSVPDMVHGQSGNVTKTVSNGTVQATATCANGTVTIGPETPNCDTDYVPAPGPTCVRDNCAWSFPTNAQTNGSQGTSTWHYSTNSENCAFTCLSGYSWNGTSCRADCVTPVSSQHSSLTYALSAVQTLHHGESSTIVGSSAFGVSPANWTLSASFAFSCSDGTLTRVSSNGSGVCPSNYSWNSNWSSPVCSPNSQTFSCAAKPATGTKWNTVSSYQQNWNGTSWVPSNSTTAYNVSPSTAECRYACDSWYGWSGTACLSTINGSCSTSGWTCTAWTVSGDNGTTACSTTRTWSCSGQYGGTTASCSAVNPACPINGTCSATLGACAAWTVSWDNGTTACATTRTWTCQGANGGTSASCAVAIPSCSYWWYASAPLAIDPEYGWRSGYGTCQRSDGVTVKSAYIWCSDAGNTTWFVTGTCTGYPDANMAYEIYCP